MRRRVLVVDDDETIREIARLSLERVGEWEVVEAASGEEAVAAATGAGPFDLVLLDVMMPGLDGPTTLERLRAGSPGPAVPVVFLTAKAQRADRQRLRGMGVAAVLSKPFDPLALPAELDAILGRWTRSRQGDR
jgi:two-component system OmpR family response regulator